MSLSELLALTVHDVVCGLRRIVPPASVMVTTPNYALFMFTIYVGASVKTPFVRTI